MSAAAKVRHARILDEGIAIASQEGLQGVTLGVLASRVGMSKSGLFAHFRSKEEVQIELLEHARVIGAPYIVEPAFAAAEGLPRLRALFENWLGWSARAGLPGGCPLAAALFEMDDLDSPVRQRALEMEGEWREFLGGLVEQAVAAGHLRKGLDSEQFVWEMGGIYLAHHVTSRFLRDREAADRRAYAAFEALVARALP